MHLPIAQEVYLLPMVALRFNYLLVAIFDPTDKFVTYNNDLDSKDKK
jgi:hypothetical protein